MKFQGKELNSKDYCTCKQLKSVTSEVDEFGYWDICCDCGKPIEDGFHYYNRYDGEDHEENFFE